MRLGRTARVVVGLVVAALAAACTGKYESDFPVIVVNRTADTIEVLANGSSIGQVTKGDSVTFNVHLPETNSNTFSNGVAPTPQADVVFTAKNVKTGSISTSREVTLTQNPPTYLTFNTSDFPNVQPASARFQFSPTNPAVNQDVFFNAATSTATNGTYTWSFGDGTSGTGQQVTHRFATTGTFSVILNLVADNGSSSASMRVTVGSGVPPGAANFTFSPTSPGVGATVTFVASPLPNLTFSWDFGDGAFGAGPTVTHAYTRAASFTVTLRVLNDVGQSATTSRGITVTSTLPAGSASFTFSPTNPGIGDDVFFNAAASTVTTGTFAWDFGDGTRGSGIRVTHQFVRAANYTVALTVTNDVNQSATTTRTVSVSTTSTDLVADFSFSPQDPTISSGTNAVIFDATPSSITATGWTWDFGDGTSTATGQKVTHTFTRAGTWVVRLTVTDASGRSASTTKSVTVIAGSFVADFSFSPQDPSISGLTNTVFFDATPSSSGATAWNWDFGDGSAQASGKQTSHTFTRVGTWVVRLTITDSTGRTATVTKNVTVKS